MRARHCPCIILSLFRASTTQDYLPFGYRSVSLISADDYNFHYHKGLFDWYNWPPAAREFASGKLEGHLLGNVSKT